MWSGEKEEEKEWEIICKEYAAEIGILSEKVDDSWGYLDKEFVQQRKNL